MIAFAGAMRLREEPGAARKEYSFGVRPRWPLDELRPPQRQEDTTTA
jgi:N6-L-threonylcarbamoyladenine synthase